MDTLEVLAQLPQKIPHLSPFIDTIMNNIILAPILWWFMREHNRLIKAFVEEQEKNRKEQLAAREVLQSVKDALLRCNRK